MDIKNTETLILDAARIVFIRKGFSGARMQEIAEEAGINKALLHYYFRSKDRLFEAVFQETMQNMMKSIIWMLNDDLPFEIKIKQVVNMYIDTIWENPFLPGFIIQELSQNPDKLVSIFKKVNPDSSLFFQQIHNEAEAGHIRKTDARHLFVNIIALSIYPIMAQPILKTVLFNNDDEKFRKFINERKTEVADFILNSLKPE